MHTFTLRTRGGAPTAHDTATLQGIMGANLILSILAMHFRFLADKVFSSELQGLNLRPHGPKPRALPTELNPDNATFCGHSVVLVHLVDSPRLELETVRL